MEATSFLRTEDICIPKTLFEYIRNGRKNLGRPKKGRRDQYPRKWTRTRIWHIQCCWW